MKSEDVLEILKDYKNKPNKYQTDLKIWLKNNEFTYMTRR